RNDKKRAAAGHEYWLVRVGEQGVERLKHGRLAAASDGNLSVVAENKPEARARGNRACFLVPLDPVPEEAATGHHNEVGNRTVDQPARCRQIRREKTGPRSAVHEDG